MGLLGNVLNLLFFLANCFTSGNNMSSGSVSHRLFAPLGQRWASKTSKFGLKTIKKYSLKTCVPNSTLISFCFKKCNRSDVQILK